MRTRQASAAAKIFLVVHSHLSLGVVPSLCAVLNTLSVNLSANDTFQGVLKTRAGETVSKQ